MTVSTRIFTITHKDSTSKARAGELVTPHGVIQTPVFMPVGTQATVKTMSSEETSSLGYKILLSNTYHLFLRPGKETLMKAGGLHKFMAWPRSILTDSGGYQVFSLAKRCKLSEEGVEFQSHVDGTLHRLTPEITTDFQLDIGADIAMCLDDCPPYPSLRSDAEKSLEQTLRWAARCKQTYMNWSPSSPNGAPRAKPGVTINDPASPSAMPWSFASERGDITPKPPLAFLPGYNPGSPAEANDRQPLLFGIVQGASFPELRRKSARETAAIGFPGYAVGGLGVGEPKNLMWEFLEASLDPLPDSTPHYLMGIGQPEDMWEAVERGVDMFDCVLPTRNGRNGQAFTSMGRVNIPNASFREEFSPLDPACSCLTCAHYTRAYLCHLFRAGELLASRLVTLHNLSYMIILLRSIRDAIINGNFHQAKREFFEKYRQN